FATQLWLALLLLAVEVGAARNREQEERAPQLRREAEGRDRGAPHAGRGDDREPLAPDMARPPAERREDERAGGRRGEEVADERRVVEAMRRERRKERRRHPEHHRVRVDEQEAENDPLRPHEAEPVDDRTEARTLVVAR